MARNGSGTMSIINTMVAGTTITASAHNQNYDDIGDEITNSVAADGQTTMTGNLKHASGTAALPSITFGADTNTGMFRSAENAIGFACDGVERFTIGTATAVFSVPVAGIFASGTALIFAQATAPVGWTKATTHDDKALRVVTGATGGSAAGTTAFSTVFAAGHVTGSTAADLAAHTHTFSTGGASADHSHTFSGNTGGESTTHTHTLNGGGVLLTSGGVGATAGGTGLVGAAVSTTDANNVDHSHGYSGTTSGMSATHTHGGTTDNAGAGGGHTHTMSIAVQYVDVIICTKD